MYYFRQNKRRMENENYKKFSYAIPLYQHPYFDYWVLVGHIQYVSRKMIT